MMMSITGIKRFAIHDGEGIRTTVFFKGCPLKCIWCHNPENIELKRQIALYRHKCNMCGECLSICKCHREKNGIHDIDRNLCEMCGKCEQLCPTEAIEIIGKKVTVEEILDVLIKDKSFYEESGGGVTLSGGECLLQADFCAELLKKVREHGINTAIDTCGYVSTREIDKVLPYTDVFLYDLKAFDEDIHIKCTGKSNKIILNNLLYLNSRKASVEIRIPYIPGFNDNQIEKIGRFIEKLDCVNSVKILPYHNYAKSKYSALDIKNTLPSKLPTGEEIARAEEKLKRLGLKCG